jgi:hypothetical protein
MNSEFEKDFIKLNKEKGSLFSADLDKLRDITLAIDVDIMLRKLKTSVIKNI